MKRKFSSMKVESCTYHDFDLTMSPIYIFNTLLFFLAPFLYFGICKMFFFCLFFSILPIFFLFDAICHVCLSMFEYGIGRILVAFVCSRTSFNKSASNIEKELIICTLHLYVCIFYSFSCARFILCWCIAFNICY